MTKTMVAIVGACIYCGLLIWIGYQTNRKDEREVMTLYNFQGKV